MARHDAIRDLGVVDLEEQTLLAHVCVSVQSLRSPRGQSSQVSSPPP